MFLIWRPDLPLAYVIVLLAVVGTAVGLVYPVTTVSIQNAVPHHQVGIAMGALNFFRSLASAFIVAVLGAILLAGLGVAPERGGRAVSVIATVGAGRPRRRLRVPLGVPGGLRVPGAQPVVSDPDGGAAAARPGRR